MSKRKPLAVDKKKKCLITAGPTREYFDPVRFISNPSSGKMGYALAEAAVEAGWEVTLISGPVALPIPEGVSFHAITTGDELLQKTHELFGQHDLLIMSAAVCDMKPRQASREKQKKEHLSMTLEMMPVPDVLKSLIPLRKAGQVVVGFAAETNDVIAHAQDKLERKQLDWIVANQVGGENSAFESDQNAVTLIHKSGEKIAFPFDSKKEIARQIIQAIAAGI